MSQAFCENATVFKRDFWLTTAARQWRPRDAQTNATKDGEEKPKAMAIPSDQAWFATNSNFQRLFFQKLPFSAKIPHCYV